MTFNVMFDLQPLFEAKVLNRRQVEEGFKPDFDAGCFGLKLLF